MKITMLLLSITAASMFFASCNASENEQADLEVVSMDQALLDRTAMMKAKGDARLAKMKFNMNTIVAIVRNTENFSQLVSALQQADVSETLMSEGEYTIFAPTNNAFSKLPKTTFDHLMKQENKAALQRLLNYHVVAGRWTINDVLNGISENNNTYYLTTLQGDNIIFSAKDDKFFIIDPNGNSSTVVMTDVDASNGIIHGIDRVIIPKM